MFRGSADLEKLEGIHRRVLLILVQDPDDDVIVA